MVTEYIFANELMNLLCNNANNPAANAAIAATAKPNEIRWNAAPLSAAIAISLAQPVLEIVPPREKRTKARIEDLIILRL